MKRSPESSSDSSDDMQLEEGLFADLLPELRQHVSSFLPLWCFIGKDAFQFTSKKWVKTPRKKFTQENLVASCHDAQGCLAIIKQDEILYKLDDDSLLQIICKDPNAVNFIIDKLSADQLVSLGKRDLAVTLRIFNTPALTKKIIASRSPTTFWLRLTIYHPEILKGFLDMFDVAALQNHLRLLNESGHHELNLLVQFILNNKEQFNKFKTAMMVRSLSGFIIKNLHLPWVLEAFHVAVDQNFDKYVANHGTNKAFTDYLLKHHQHRLTIDLLGQLALYHAHLAQMIFDNHKIFQLSSSDLIALGNKYLSYAQRILQSDELMQKLSTPPLFYPHLIELKDFYLNQANLITMLERYPSHHIEIQKLFDILALPEIQEVLNRNGQADKLMRPKDLPTLELQVQLHLAFIRYSKKIGQPQEKHDHYDFEELRRRGFCSLPSLSFIARLIKQYRDGRIIDEENIKEPSRNKPRKK